MIKKFTINNFKSIKHIELDVPNFAIIVGNNGAGKTNLLKAIKFISLLSQKKQIDDALSILQLLPNELLYDSNNNKISFLIELDINGRQIKYSFEVVQELDGTKYRHRVLTESLTNGHQGMPILKREGESINISQEEGAPGHVIGLTDSQLALSTLTSPAIVNETRNVLSRIVVDTFVPIQLRQIGALSKIGSDSELNLAEKLYSLVSSKSNSFSSIEAEAKEVISGLNSISVSPSLEDNSLYVKFKETGIEKEITFFSASDGNLRSLGILAAIFGDPLPSLLFIDEIENSLHPRRIRALVKLLNFVADKENRSVQTIITTHNPVVLNCITHPQIRYIYRKENATVISEISKEKKVMEYLERGAKEGTTLGDLFEAGILERIYTSS